MFKKPEIKIPSSKPELRGTWDIQFKNHVCEKPKIETIPDEILVGTTWACDECEGKWNLTRSMQNEKKWESKTGSSDAWRAKRKKELMNTLAEAITMNTLAGIGEKNEVG